MNKKLKTIGLLVYFAIVIAINLVFSTVVEIFPLCDNYSNVKLMTYQFLIILVGLPLFGFLFSVLLKIEKSTRFLFYLFIPIVSGIFVFGCQGEKRKKIAKTSICIVNIAKVKDINRGKNTHYVDVTYRKDGKRYKRDEVRFLGKSAVKTLHIGDSLLVLSVKDCDAIMYVYKPHPTLQEFKKCADYGYYFNGNLYSKEEFEGKNIE